MSLERWGTLSVRDHIDATALANDVLMYDKLVFPDPGEDREQRGRWHEERWDPDLLDRRFAQLGPLAVRRRWDRGLRAEFRQLMDMLRFDAQFVPDAETDDDAAFSLTKVILHQDEAVKRAAGSSGVRIVAAYRDEQAFQQDFTAAGALDRDQGQAHVALMVATEFVMPFTGAIPGDEALGQAIELAKTPSFVATRRRYHDWQETIAARIAEGIRTPREALDEIRDIVHDYNEAVTADRRQARVDAVFTYLGFGAGAAAAGLAGAAGHLPEFALGAVGALAPMMAYWVKKDAPAISDRLEPAAMFRMVREGVHR